jgi:hypothetical protein
MGCGLKARLIKAPAPDKEAGSGEQCQPESLHLEMMDPIRQRIAHQKAAVEAFGKALNHRHFQRQPRVRDLAFEGFRTGQQIGIAAGEAFDHATQSQG